VASAGSGFVVRIGGILSVLAEIAVLAAAIFVMLMAVGFFQPS
jgi:hypothetical protein